MPLVFKNDNYFYQQKTMIPSCFVEEQQLPLWKFQWPKWAIDAVNKLGATSAAIDLVSEKLEREGFKNGNGNSNFNGN